MVAFHKESLKIAPGEPRTGKEAWPTRIREKAWRSILKSFSWRITATSTTVGIAWLITGDVASALEIGGIEFFLKMLIYYLHERLWGRLRIGQQIERMPPPDYQI